MGWTGTESWLRGGYSTTRPSQRLKTLLEPYRMKARDWRRKVQEAGTATNGDERSTVRVSALFDPEPQTWGARGDPYLWRALRAHLADQDIPASAGELTSLLRERDWGSEHGRTVEFASQKLTTILSVSRTSG